MAASHKVTDEQIIDAVKQTYPGVVEGAIEYRVINKSPGESFVDVRIPVDTRPAKKEKEGGK